MKGIQRHHHNTIAYLYKRDTGLSVDVTDIQMKFITEEENRKTLDNIKTVGWENYRENSINECVNLEPKVVRIKGTIEDYAKRNGYTNASEAMKIIENTRCQ